MTIDRLNSIDPIRDPQKSQANDRISQVHGKDSILISKDAAKMAEIYRIIEIAKSSPDIRVDKVAALKEKLQSGSYITDALIQATADKITNQILGTESD